MKPKENMEVHVIMKTRKATLDDGCNPELVCGADFDGYLGIPIIHKPEKMIIPSGMTPFTYRNRITSDSEAICFHEKDPEFSDVLIHPDDYLDVFRKHILISPDCSLYRDAPLAVQITNVYRNRALGSYYQRKGACVIPLIRWGNSLTYTTKVLPEKVAFLGVEKHSIVSIGTYGCIQSAADKREFRAGLNAMLDTLEPEIVLVYGAMPDTVFSDFKDRTRFVHYPDWTSRMHGGNR